MKGSKPQNPRSRGFKSATYRLEPAQIAALQREALRRAAEAGTGKPDASALVREALAAWLMKQ